MVVLGRVQNGVVVLEDRSALPEGAVVTVSYKESSTQAAAERRRIQVPLVRTCEPGTVDLTGERIAEILGAEDAAS